MHPQSLKGLCTAILLGGCVASTVASAAIVITEVDPYGSNGSDGYSADWFELTNTGSSSVSIAGWTMVDQHAASIGTSSLTPYSGTISIGNIAANSTFDGTFGAAALTLASGQTSIAAGQSVVFLESQYAATTTGTSSAATLFSNFEKTWFGTNVPSSLALGTYNDGSSAIYGLSQTNDMVNIFNGASTTATLEASVAFGADGGTPVSTFDNAAGLNNAILTQKSVAGVNGAFVSATGGLEVGSPGVVPLPSSVILLLSGVGAFGMFSVGKKRVGKAPG